jgi:hypothetical protein
MSKSEKMYRVELRLTSYKLNPDTLKPDELEDVQVGVIGTFSRLEPAKAFFNLILGE